MTKLLNHIIYFALSLSFCFSLQASALPINELNLQVEVSGQGDTVVLFESGFGTGPEVWQPLVDLLPANVIAVRYARAGTGQSPAHNPSTGMAQHLTDLAALAQQVGRGKKLILVGHSYGGLLATEYARQHSAELYGLLLIDPAVMQQRHWFKAADAKAVAAEDVMLSKIMPPTLLPQFQQLNRDLDQAAQQVTALPSDLKTVLLTSTRVEAEPFAFVETAAGKQQWLRLHQALFAEVTNGSHLRTNTLGHNMMQEDPAFVLNALKTLL